MTTLCIVSCGKKKIWDKYPKVGPTQARNVYTGGLSKKGIEYAEKYYPHHYRILSAKYGFIKPDFEIPTNYNITFKKISTLPISIDDLEQQIRQNNLDHYDRIVAIGGKEYIDRLKILFRHKVVYDPLKGSRGNGEMMAKLKRAILKNSPL